ncbi:DNA topoisomerase IB [Ginsengibacter hankyongi]|uniref:DNA topoisomerase n=1 Tax=Ginsengibacter hankyongi TaxID=2607284 RepID=A0A5J5INR7_9BACT|nr:DNA topoisomerase IB [Ginsengibacter hankyongi]KAA9041647.1 DNA topoisomerase IB [Ginsengibacter hankyongi]
MNETIEVPKITKRILKSIVKDEEKTARAANLVYVTDQEPGIERKKKGDKFEYYFNGKIINDDEELLRIKHLVIPPAWTNVWICKKENGHLQVTGYDIKNRKQYKYHPHWNSLRNHTKFYRLLDFGKVLPAIREQLEKDINSPELSLKKVLAAVVKLMERTNIRIGNNYYEKTYGSFGLTTLKDKHVKFNGHSVTFAFVGKKGVSHNITLKNKKLAGIIKKCRDIPGKELFQFYDEEGNHQSIDSGLVNNYIREISNADFTAKDFRTWSGTVQAFLALKSIGCCDTQTETKRRIVEALDTVSEQLGNTRTVCKKYYVHPLILSLYESKDLEKYMNELDRIENSNNKIDLTPEEKIVLKILESN